MKPRHGLHIWIGGYPPPPGWDRGTDLAGGWTYLANYPALIERVSVPEHARVVTEALAEWAESKGFPRIAVEVRA